MKRIACVASFLLLAVPAAVPATPAPQHHGADLPDRAALERRGFSLSEIARILQGFAISPVPLDLHRKDVALVGLGSYIVNAQGGCNDCHTSPPYAPGGDPFQGEPEHINVDRYLAGGTPFGPFISRNLTPDEDGRPAGMTFRQFRRTLRTGVDLKHLPPHVPSSTNDLLQVMPWPVFGKMIERDLRAVYEFLRAIPPRAGYPE